MKSAYKLLENINQEIKDDGMWKSERVIVTPQSAKIDVADQKDLLNMCANNYLGLSNNSEIIKSAKDSYDKYGYGLSSVRFICGTQSVHKELESKIGAFLGMEDTILYSSCFDANTGLFETLLNAEDAIISDELNHASIIDGVRLCKAKRFRYKNNDMQSLEEKLKEAHGSRMIMVCTDGVFSMDGTIANLKGICDLAEKYDALVMVDDSHSVGFVGKNGRGTHEYCDVMGRVDIITGTLGKALGGASGGYTSANKTIVDLMRQRSRPYLFSNTLAPAIAASACTVFDMLSENTELRDKLEENTFYFREKIHKAGFEIKEGTHPIVPIMLYDARVAQEMAAKMLQKGVYVIGFFYPVVPKGLARIRVQISAAHTKEDLDFAVKAFIKCRDEMVCQNVYY